MKRGVQRLLILALAVLMVVLIIRTLSQVRGAASDQDEEEEEKKEAIKSPSRVSVQNGQTVIKLDPETQSQTGITVSLLEAVTTRKEIKAPALVLSAQELVTARHNYVSAQTALEKAQASVQVLQQESDRLKTLYDENQNASQRALQSAQGSLRSGQADVQAARQDLALQSAQVRQSWGGVVAEWIMDGTPVLDDVFSQRDFLVQVTLPAGAGTVTPDTMALELPGSGYAQAKLISSFPRTDPRIQGMTFLYLVESHPGLAPGLNLAARLPVGPIMHGVLVPQQAVVWLRGNAWLYQETAPGSFVRRRLPDEMPLPNGGFVCEDFSAGDRIVTAGAQALLSEEFRSPIQPED